MADKTKTSGRGSSRGGAHGVDDLSPEILEQRERVLEEQERFLREVASQEESIHHKERDLLEALDTERLTADKLRLYEAFVSGKITRGALDRKLDELYALKHRAERPLHPPQTPREPDALKIVHRYMWWSAGTGLIPLPGVDLVALTTVQVLMLRKLCELYEIPFSQQWGKSLVTALVGGLTPSYLKAIPGIGTLVGVITGPIFNVASSYAVGRVFTQHFESGGTMLTFDPAKMKGYFREYFETGRTLAKS